MKFINISEKVKIEIIDKPIGIIASGGADSSLLLYFVMKYTDYPLHIFTCSSTLKGRANSTVISKVVEKCIQLTGNMNIFQHNFYVEEQTKYNLWDYPYSFVEEGKINAIYCGATANPPSDIANSFNEPNSEDSDRNPNVTRPLWTFNNKLYSPFTNIDKREIAKIYDMFDLSNTLFPYTRSCEKVCESVQDLEYYEHCDNCWWCGERRWGFGKL